MHSTSKAYRTAKKLRRIKNRYGPYFFKDLKDTHCKPFCTLSSVAEKYKISREWVRQIHKTVYGRGFTEWKRRKSDQRKLDESLACLHDPRRKFADYKPTNSPPYKGAAAEALFFRNCERLKLDPKPPSSPEIDLEVNGYRVEVKSAYKTTTDGYYFRYQVSDIQRIKAHFFACYHPFRDSFFIIPNIDIRNMIFILKDVSKGDKYWCYENTYSFLTHGGVLPPLTDCSTIEQQT